MQQHVNENTHTGVWRVFPKEEPQYWLTVPASDPFSQYDSN